MLLYSFLFCIFAIVILMASFIGRDGQFVIIRTLDNIPDSVPDTLVTVLIGNSQSGCESITSAGSVDTAFDRYCIKRYIAKVMLKKDSGSRG